MPKQCSALFSPRQANGREDRKKLEILIEWRGDAHNGVWSLLSEHQIFLTGTELVFGWMSWLFHLVFQLGALSSTLEHAIPEQMFYTARNPGEAISAVKALEKAARAGQRVYHIGQRNLAVALADNRLDEGTRQEIRDSVAIGKEVIAHTDPVSIPGWTGAGYVIFDPLKGDGAWRIGGGANGGETEPGVIDFAFALADDPGLIFPTCALPFFDQMIENFLNTNSAIFGIAAPPGLSLLTAGAVAEAAGGFTLLKAIRLSIKDPFFALGNLRVGLMISIINFFLVSLVFEIALLVGSGISAAFCRRES